MGMQSDYLGYKKSVFADVSCWPMMVDNRSQPDVRFRGETNFG
jgi:hypothetical protein